MSRYFTRDHEWIDVEGNTGTVGITDYAQGQLGDITYVELPTEGLEVKKAASVCVVDSVKAASDVYAPVAGTISEVNDALADEPELVNSDAEGDGWLFRIAIGNSGELADLLDEAAYNAYVAEL